MMIRVGRLSVLVLVGCSVSPPPPEYAPPLEPATTASSAPPEPPAPPDVAAPIAAAGTAAPPAPAGKRRPCTLGADQECNADIRVSAIWGRCTELGVCECKPGFVLNPSGFCSPSP